MKTFGMKRVLFRMHTVLKSYTFTQLQQRQFPAKVNKMLSTLLTGTIFSVESSPNKNSVVNSH